MRKRRLFVLGSAISIVSALGTFNACSGSDGASTSSGSDASTGVDGTVSSNDAGAPTDAGNSSSDAANDSSASNGDASFDAGTDSGPPYFDAGSVAWTNGVVDAGAFTPLTSTGNSTGDSSCTFELGTVTVGIPPTYDLYLEKKDTTAGSCTEPKGFLFLVGSVDYTPAAFLASATSAKLLAVTYDFKSNLSGESPVMSSLSQIDWVTGNTLHAGAFGLKNADAGGPPGPGMGSTYVTALSITGSNVVVTGSGRFPGAPNNTFTATYDNFVEPEYQAQSFADTVM